MRELHDLLLERAASAGLQASRVPAAALLEYYELLRVWNGAMNLTGFDLTVPHPAAIDRLLIEPLKAASWLRASTAALMDLGSGGGSPAIPMKLARPEIRLTMVESKVKKSMFLRRAARHLGLQETHVHHGRYQSLFDHGPFRDTFDAVTARAIRLSPAELPLIAQFLGGSGALYLFVGSHEPRADAQLGLPSHSLVPELGSILVVLDKACLLGHSTKIF